MAIDPTDHYENFPVASLLLPRHLRAPVAAIYRFARSADDIADEGTATAEERLSSLQSYDDALKDIAAGRSIPPGLAAVFTPLALTHQQTHLPLAPCHALLSAFMQDVQQTRYASYPELLNYCARSANPVGHLMLFLFKADTPENRALSDAICSALQLTNHWQDIAIDATKGQAGRIYLPQNELVAWGYHDADILSGAAQRDDPARWAHFMHFQTARVSDLYDQGQPLPARLGRQSWRIGQELRLTIAGGRRILSKINATGGDIFTQRPQLDWRDWLQVLISR